MATLHESMADTEFAEVFDDELGPKPHCIDFISGAGRPRRPSYAGYRSLLHEDCNKEKWWEERVVLCQIRWKGIVHEIMQRNSTTNKRRNNKTKPRFSYDSRSYALNFDEGEDRGVASVRPIV